MRKAPLHISSSVIFRCAKAGAAISNNKKSPKPIKITQVWFDNKKAKSTKVFERSSLPSGFTLKGPAIIVQEDATTLLPPNCSLKVDKKLNLVLRT